MKVEKNSLQFKTRFTEKAKQKVLKIRQQNRKVFIGILLRGIYIQTAICNLSLEIEMEQDKES
jgi:hypothetical protein